MTDLILSFPFVLNSCKFLLVYYICIFFTFASDEIRKLSSLLFFFLF